MKIPLIIGVIFILVGIGILLFAKRRKWNGIIPLLLGSGLFYIFMWGPMKNSDEKLKRVISLQPGSIKEIQLMPVNSGEYDEETNLVMRTSHITDSIYIARLCGAISKGYVFEPGNSHKGINWVCRVTIITNDNDFINSVLVKGDDGAFMKIYSGDNSWNWYYGAIRTDEFGVLIGETSRFLH